MRVEALPDPLVVDASVALKWVVDEPGSDAAFSLVAGQTLVTSALFWAEAANALASKERRGELAQAPLETAPLDLPGAMAALALAARVARLDQLGS